MEYFNKLKLYLPLLLCYSLVNSCCLYFSGNRSIGIVFESKRQLEERYKNIINSDGPYVHSPAPRLTIEDIYETEHCYIIKATSYMNGNREAYLLYSIRDDDELRNNQDTIGVSNVSIHNCEISGEMIIPVYGMDSDIIRTSIYKGIKEQREKENAIREFLKDNFYPDYIILDAKYNQGNLFTVRNLNGIHLLEKDDHIVNSPHRFYIEAYTNPKTHHLEYHVYIRKK